MRDCGEDKHEEAESVLPCLLCECMCSNVLDSNASWLSVRPLINSSICKFDKVFCICVIHARDKFLAAELAEIMKLCVCFRASN